MIDVSVLMPVYNCEQYLEQAVLSILGQTIGSFELVIVDDGSTDGTLAIASAQAGRDRRIRLFSQSNTGITGALNRGLSECVGRYVARMDGDDLAEPSRLADQMAFLDARPDIGVVGGWAVVIDEVGRSIDRLVLPTSPTEIAKSLSEGNYALLHPTIMVRRSLLQQVGGYDTAFRYAEDLDLLLRLSEITCLANLPCNVLKYRRRSESMSDLGKNNYPLWDQKALLAARGRDRRKVSAGTLARAAERVSWSALADGDTSLALGQALRSWRHAPWHRAGFRALARVGRHWFRPGRKRSADGSES